LAGCADTAAGNAALNTSARMIPVVLVMKSSTQSAVRWPLLNQRSICARSGGSIVQT
jgi:hypothetical protein